MATIQYLDNGKYYEVSYRGEFYGCDTFEEARILCFKLEHKILGIFAHKMPLDKIKVREYCIY